jgi:peptidyl-prolyl cis-trans isomerase D
MALINKIREKSTLVIAFVAIGLGLFIVGGDILGPNSAILGSNKQYIGEIDGEDIKIEDFSNETEAYKLEYQYIYKYKFNESEMGYVRNKAWERLVERVALSKEFEELGITVTEEELKDMVQGNNIIPEIAEGFKDPNTGAVDRTNIIRYLQNLSRYPQEQQMAFYMLEAGLRPKRLREKYNNLIMQTYYITDEEAKQRYEEANTKLDLNYLIVHYSSIPDSTVTVSDEQLRDYYNRNKKLFKQDMPTAALEFVSFPVIASSQDSADLKREMEQIREDFAKTDNDSLFIKSNSEAFDNFRSYTLSELPASIVNNFKAEKGFISEIVSEANAYRIYKVLNVGKDSLYTMRASHILISCNEKDCTGEKRDEARKKAMEVLNKAKAGEDFAKLAAEYGQDGTKSVGGDLKWFKQGQMVERFEKPVMAATKEGLIPNLVETEYGFHIVNVTATKRNDKVDLGIIAKPIVPSEATRNEMYQVAGDFATASNEADFVARADERRKTDKNFMRSEALDVRLDAKYINSLSGNLAREVAMWAFKKDTEVGKVSKVFEGDDMFVVALLKKRYEDDYAPMEKVADKVLNGARNEIKAKQIIEKLSKSSGKSLEEMAADYGKDAKQLSVNVAFNSYSLQGLGYAPKALGTAFGLKDKARSNFIEEEAGVTIIEIKKIDRAAEIADYNKYREEIFTDKRGIWNSEIIKAVEKLTGTRNDINRYY